MQTGLLTAYILKALSFGRYVLFSKDSHKMDFSKWHEVGTSKFNNYLHIMELEGEILITR